MIINIHVYFNNDLLEICQFFAMELENIKETSMSGRVVLITQSIN